MQDQIEINNSLIKNNKQKQKKIIKLNSSKILFYIYILISYDKSSDKFVRPFKFERPAPKF